MEGFYQRRWRRTFVDNLVRIRSVKIGRLGPFSAWTSQLLELVKLRAVAKINGLRILRSSFFSTHSGPQRKTLGILLRRPSQPRCGLARKPPILSKGPRAALHLGRDPEALTLVAQGSPTNEVYARGGSAKFSK